MSQSTKSYINNLGSYVLLKEHQGYFYWKTTVKNCIPGKAWYKLHGYLISAIQIYTTINILKSKIIKVMPINQYFNF